MLQDVYGNRYMYSHLGTLASRYPVPKPHPQAAARATRSELELPKADAKPTAPATAGKQPTAKAAHRSAAHRGKHRVAASGAAVAADGPVATKERLFAHPARPAAYAAGGKRQLEELGQPLESFAGYFTRRSRSTRTTTCSSRCGAAPP